VADSCLILEGLRNTYEEHHHVRYAEGALEAAVKLADRYITGRFLPDKAIDVMDEAGARARISGTLPPPDTYDIECEIEEVREAKESAIDAQNFEEAAKFRDRERELHAALEDVKNKWREQLKKRFAVITPDDIAAVVASLTGIPVQKVTEGLSKRLLQMEDELQKVVVGQQEAVRLVSKALRRSYAGLKNPDRPIGSFIFLGPTGVGKTLLAKSLADFMFDDPEALIQVDMSEYMEKFNVSRLIGSPPGYIGHGEGGELTERVRRRPYSVVLFDEIEKAHPDVMLTLLQVLEEGQLTDSMGRKIDFRNTVIIMTSNVGASAVNQTSPLGFVSSADSIKDDERLLGAAKKAFKPEFINRVDNIVTFNRLDRANLLEIINIEIGKLRGRLNDQGLALEISDAALEFLLDNGFKPEYGARPVRRALEQYIEGPLADELLMGNFAGSTGVKIDCTGGQISFSPVKAEKKRKTVRRSK
jgi:ATP-dependent Clp protease ATP-binding subunit ClpC